MGVKVKQSVSTNNLKFLTKSEDFSKKPILFKSKGVEKWFELQFNDVISNPATEVSKDLYDKFVSYAENLLKNESHIYEKRNERKKTGEAAWMKSVSIGGTVADKVAALILQVQESPLHNLQNLEILLSKLVKNNRRETLLAAESVKSLFVESLLPDRKLLLFKNRPLCEVFELSSGNQNVIDKRLLIWYFEHKLKECFEKFVHSTEKLCHDTVETTRIKGAEILADLLENKPEQENFLLASLVNKLGDASSKVSTKVVAFLLRLFVKHSNMKMVAVLEVEKLIYRHNVALRAQYYGVVFLSQISLRRTVDTDLSSKLISIYFNLFKFMVNKGCVDNKMLSVLLNGTNKAISLAKGNVDSIMKDIDTLYKVVAVSNLNTSLQALLLLLQVLETNEGVTDRFYCALYRKLLDPCLESSTHHHAFFFHLLFKTLKSDATETRVLAFVKRLLQVCLHCTTPTFICACLMLLSELAKDSPLLLKFEKSAQSSALLKSINVDAEDDDDEEYFVDVHSPDSDAESSKKEDVYKKPSWIHKKNIKGCNKRYDYDIGHRNPLFANAETTLLYEIGLLKNHYHPTVVLFVEKFLNREVIEYQGDPLQDFTLIRFLDRFVFRNPKKPKLESNKKDAIMKKRKTYNPWGVKKLAVTSTDYAKITSEEIPVDEQYLHKYMTSFVKQGEGDADLVDEDVESVASDEFDQVLERFEPGKKSEQEFLMDFSKSITSQQVKRKRKKSLTDEDDDDEEENNNEQLPKDEAGSSDSEEFEDIVENHVDSSEVGRKQRKKKINKRKKKK